MDELLLSIKQFYSSTFLQLNQPENHRKVSKYLHQIPNHPQSWELSFALMTFGGSQESRDDLVNIRFFGAQIFLIKVQRDFDSLEEPVQTDLKDRFFQLLLDFLAGTSHEFTEFKHLNVLLRKLCVDTVALAIHCHPKGIWKTYLTDFYQNFFEEPQLQQQQQQLQQGAMIDIPFWKKSLFLFEFWKALADEFASLTKVLSPQQRVTLEDQIRSFSLTVFAFCENMLKTEVLDNFGDILILKLCAIGCVTSWINFGAKLEELSTILPIVMSHIRYPELFDEVVELLIALIVSPANSAMKETMSSLLPILSELKPKLDEAIQNEDELTAKPLARLFSSFADSFPSVVIKRFYDPSTQTYLSMLLDLTNFPGIVAADQEITEIPLNSWYMIMDVLYHEETGVFLEDNERKLAQIKIDGRNLFMSLLEVCLAKASMPDETLYQSWTAEVKEMFANVRCDLGDTCNYIYLVANDMVLGYLVERLGNTMQQLETNSIPWQNIEVLFHTFYYVSESVPKTENTFIPVIFQILSGTNPSTWMLKGSNQLVESCLKMIGGFAEWLQSREEYLTSCVSFVLPFLSHPELSGPSAIAFKNLCDIGGEKLIGNQGVEPIIDGFWSMHESVRMKDKLKIMEALTMLIVHEADPLRSHGLFQRLLGPLFGLVNESTRTEVISEYGLQLLIACSSHLLEIDGLPVYKDMIEKTYSLVRWVFDEAWTNQNLMLLTCNYLNQIIRTCPSLLPPVLFDLFRLLSESCVKYLLTINLDDLQNCGGSKTNLSSSDLTLATAASANCPGIGEHALQYVIDVGASLISVYADEKDPVVGEMYKFIETILCTFFEVNRVPSLEQLIHLQPDTVSNVFGFCSRAIRRCPYIWFRLGTGTPHLLNRIYSFSLDHILMQEKRCIGSIAQFLRDLVYCKRNAVYSQEADILFVESKLGQVCFERIMSALAGSLPRSYIITHLDLAYTLQEQFKPKLHEWLSQCLSRDGFPSIHVTVDDKRQFIDRLLKCRGQRSFKECMTDFLFKCRKLDPNYGRATSISLT